MMISQLEYNELMDQSNDHLDNSSKKYIIKNT